ncbi:MAG TPA: hypothetical protein EYQ50_23075 [Verrucomicrobiales bacterium]|jgi:hypothetical protein|nr:hypothetical protein [Verrucomicrobiales bacterium]HIL69984.1 hypothetical protein [Verrucomicrobiota bacterium]
MNFLPKVLFGLSLTLCLLIGVVLSIQEIPFTEIQTEGAHVKSAQGHGMTHPQFETMKIGGSGEARHGRILWLGWAFGLIQICFFVALLALGSNSSKAQPSILKPLGVGFLLYAGVFTLMIASYHHFMLSDSKDLILGLPRPTAWMIYGLWTAPVWFIGLYISTFKRLIWSDNDQKQFNRILEMREKEVAKHN